MKRNDAFRFYKSGINKISARQNPFADAADEASSTASDDAAAKEIKIRSNTWIVIAAALAICFAVGTFVLLLNSDNMGTADDPRTSDTGLDTSSSVVNTDSSANDLSSMITTTEVSSVIVPDVVPDSSQNDDTSSAAEHETDTPVPRLVIDDDTQVMINGYSLAEDSIQSELRSLDKLRRTDANDKDKIEKSISMLQSNYSLQQDIIEKLYDKRGELPSLMILDSRFIEGAEPPVLRLAILNLTDKTFEFSDFIRIEFPNKQTAVCKVLENKVIEKKQVKYLNVDPSSFIENILYEPDESNLDTGENNRIDEYNYRINASIRTVPDADEIDIPCVIKIKTMSALSGTKEKSILERYEDATQQFFEKIEVIK